MVTDATHHPPTGSHFWDHNLKGDSSPERSEAQGITADDENESFQEKRNHNQMTQTFKASDSSTSHTEYLADRPRNQENQQMHQHKQRHQPQPTVQQRQVKRTGKSKSGAPAVRLDLNLDVEVELKARIQGDITLSLP